MLSPWNLALKNLAQETNRVYSVLDPRVLDYNVFVSSPSNPGRNSAEKVDLVLLVLAEG